MPLYLHDTKPCPSITTQLESQVLKSMEGHPPAPGTDVTVADVDCPLRIAAVAENDLKVDLATSLNFPWLLKIVLFEF